MDFLEAWLEKLPVVLCPVLNLEYGFRWKIFPKFSARCGAGVFVVVVLYVIEPVEN